MKIWRLEVRDREADERAFADMIRETNGEFTPEDVQTIVRTAFRGAKEGDDVLYRDIAERYYNLFAKKHPEATTFAYGIQDWFRRYFVTRTLPWHEEDKVLPNW